MKKMLLLVAFFVLSVSAFSVEIGTVQEPPGNFTDEDGNVVGLSVDFVKEIQRRIGDTTPINILPGARLIQYSKEKRNYVIFSLSRTESREDQYHWISLVMRKPLVMFAKKGANLNIRNLEDAKRVRAIGVLRGSIQDIYLQENNFTNIEPATEHEMNLRKLMSGRLDIMYHSVQ